MPIEQQEDSKPKIPIADAEIAGWDPFLVWCTRVRDPQRLARDAVGANTEVSTNAPLDEVA